MNENILSQFSFITGVHISFELYLHLIAGNFYYRFNWLRCHHLNKKKSSNFYAYCKILRNANKNIKIIVIVHHSPPVRVPAHASPSHHAKKNQRSSLSLALPRAITRKQTKSEECTCTQSAGRKYFVASRGYRKGMAWLRKLRDFIEERENNGASTRHLRRTSRRLDLDYANSVAIMRAPTRRPSRSLSTIG